VNLGRASAVFAEGQGLVALRRFQFETVVPHRHNAALRFANQQFENCVVFDHLSRAAIFATI
jgi:hypothetical protein